MIRYYATERGAVERRRHGQTHRAREFSAFDEHIELDHLLALQDWTCHICWQHIAKGDESLDHVTPLAKSGRHNYQNCIAAHRNCNTRKSAKLGHVWGHPATIGFGSECESP